MLENLKKYLDSNKTMEHNNITLTGCHLATNEIVRLVSDETVQVIVPEDVLAEVDKSRSFMEKHARDRITYGVNTGFGPMASYIIGADDLETLQLNLVRSHATGVGEPVSSDYVLAAMVVRLNTLLRGYSAVSRELIISLQDLINKRVIPVVPEHGAVGTSGDLVQLAHIAEVVIGEGEVTYKGERQPTAKVFKKLKLQPYTLKAKEGLALINGTAFMTGTGALLVSEAERIVNVATKNGAMALEIMHGFRDSISETLHGLRPHEGQVAIAAHMRKLLETSKLLRDRPEFQTKFTIEDDTHHIPEEVQEVYSLRCIPQILGPVYDTVQKTKQVIETEMNSVSDNPIVDHENGMLLHGGNFHGDYIATAIDQLKMTLVKLTMLTERRVNLFLNSKVNQHLPPFLNLNKPGLTLSLQALQFIATSTTAQSQSLAFPHSVHSISTNADNQDVVSMGTDAALILSKVIDNCDILLAIELIVLCQAVDVTKSFELMSQPAKEEYEQLRLIFPAVIDDRSMRKGIEEVIHFIRHRNACLAE